MIRSVLVIVLLVGCTWQEETPKQETKKLPVYIPGRCPENQLLYSGDEKDDLFCDCGPGYIYYATADGCFMAYHQGPCKVKEILTVEKGSPISKCVKNPCPNDGFVKYNNECYELNTRGPCNGTDEILTVNEATIQPECSLKVGELLYLFQFPPNCPPASRRSLKRCRAIY